MKSWIYTFAFFVFAVPVCGQVPKTVNCDLQELAIEAALGNPTAQYNLAVELHRGEKIPQDLASAAVLWRMATKAGNVGAFNNLGHLTYYGRGIKLDYAEGVRLWRVAAMKGFAESQVHLGHAYTDGKFLRKNAIEAYAWASAGKHNAALLSDPEMQKAIGEMAEDARNQATASLTKAQLAAAKQKAALYIRQYPPVDEEF